MNERIKELMGNTIDEKFAGTWSTMDMQDLTKFSERFAELIIKECVSVINTEAAEHEDDDECERAWKMGTEFAVYQIKEHFGVEE